MAASSFARLSLARSPLAFLLGSCIAVLAGLGANRQAAAQPALPALPSWADAAAIEAAKKEATLVVYSSVNEEEALRIWRRFEELTGVKVEYVRGSDTQLIARMAIESRAGRGAWDVALMTAAHKLPQQMLAAIDPSEARHLFPVARDASRKWYGFSANYNVPAYNAARLATNLSMEGQTMLTRRGRIPSRPDVETNPPGVLKALHERNVMPIQLNAEQEKKADGVFKELIAGRPR